MGNSLSNHYLPNNLLGDSCIHKEDSSWYFVIPSKNYTFARQGWKIYISMSPATATEIINKVGVFLINKAIPFKYIKSSNKLKELNSGLLGYSQIGKSFVIYLSEFNREVVKAILLKMSDFTNTAQTPPFTNKIAGGMPISYRYGSYQDLFLESEKGLLKDDRYDQYSELPEGVTDQFSELGDYKQEDNKLEGFLLKYPVIDVISQRGKGGVFTALDLSQESYTEVILKCGYYLGEVSEFGTEGAQMVRNEILYTKLISELKLTEYPVAKLIDSFDFGKTVVAVNEKVEGRRLDIIHHQNEIDISLGNRCLNAIKCLHDNGIYWGDAKLGNVLLNKDGKLIYIDFEFAGSIHFKSNNIAATFRFTDQKQMDAKKNDIIHFIASILYDPSKEDHRSLSINKYCSEKYNSPIKCWAQKELIKALTMP